jgi:sensor domain CHASE-containing protein
MFIIRPMPIDEKSIKRFEMRPALIVFVVCTIVGWSVVGWLVSSNRKTAVSRAKDHAQALACSLEVPLQQTISAAETLAVISRQNNGPIPNFSKVAGEILKTRPALAFLELQPSGVVSEIFPMSNSAIGFNVLNNPLQRAGAYAAMKNNQLTVSGAMELYSKERGMVARVPIFARTRDGRESFWGFVAASMSWNAATDQALFNATENYDYILIRSATAEEHAFKISGTLPNLKDAVVQPIRAANAEFKLAIKPQGGWISITWIVIGGLIALIPATILGLLVNLLENRESLESSLNETKQRLTRESSQRQQAVDECQNTKDEAASIQVELKQLQTAQLDADSKLAEIQAKLENATEAKEAALGKVRETEAEMVALQARLDAALKKSEETAQARKKEREEARATVEQAQKTISDMQARSEAGASADKKASTALQSQLVTAQAAVADLQRRLESATRSAQEGAEASAAKLKQAEKKIDALEERLQEAEKKEAKAAELKALLEQTQAELVALQNAQEAAAPEIPPAVEEVAAEPPVEPQVIEAPKPEAQAEIEQPVEPPIAEPEKAPVVEAPAPPAEPEAKPPKRKKARRDEQMDFFSNPVTEKGPEPVVPTAAAAEPVEEEKPPRRLPPPPPMDETEFRKAVHEMLPLLADRDPGAKDCLKANRNTYRSGFSPEAFDDFERAVKGGDYNDALELLKKAGRKHGASV